MHVLSIKTGLKLIALLILGILLVLSLAILVYKSYQSLAKRGTASASAPAPAAQDAAKDEKALAMLLDGRTHHFVRGYNDTGSQLEITVDGVLWKQQPSLERKSYLRAIARLRSSLGFNSPVKVFDKSSHVEMSSYEHGRVTLREDQDGS